MTFKDQNYFLNYICFIFIHLANKAFQIIVKTPDVVHFEFLDLSWFLRPHPNRFYYTLPPKTPSGTWRKIRHALLGNSTHTYARNYTLSVLKSSWYHMNYLYISWVSEILTFHSPSILRVFKVINGWWSWKTCEDVTKLTKVAFRNQRIAKKFFVWAFFENKPFSECSRMKS